MSALLSILIVVVFVLCVALIVMLAVRPGVFKLLIREFTGGTSDVENQEQTSVNWKKGGLRLTIVLSVLLGGIAGITDAALYKSAGAFLLNFFIFFAMTWIIYFAIRFVIAGFTSKD